MPVDGLQVCPAAPVTHDKIDDHIAAYRVGWCREGCMACVAGASDQSLSYVVLQLVRAATRSAVDSVTPRSWRRWREPGCGSRSRSWSERYRRFARRRGKKRVLVAVGRSRPKATLVGNQGAEKR